MITIIAVTFIVAVCAPAIWSFSDKTPASIAGVLSAAAITYLLWHHQGNWAFASMMLMISILAYSIGFLRKSDGWHWVSFTVGVFGSLIPGLTGLKSRIDVSAMTIPWGWIIIVIIAVSIAVLVMLRKKT